MGGIIVGITDIIAATGAASSGAGDISFRENTIIANTTAPIGAGIKCDEACSPAHRPAAPRPGCTASEEQPPAILAGEQASDRIRIHDHDDSGNKIADIADKTALQPVHEARIEGVLQVFVNGDGFIRRVEEVEADLEGLHDHENHSQQ